MARPTGLTLVDRMRSALRAPADLPDLVDRVHAAIGRHIRFDFGCLATTDPATGVITWAGKTRSLGVGDEAFAALEYGPPDLNSFAEIGTRTPAIGGLSLDTGGRPETCRRHRELMQPEFGFTDEVRMVLLHRGVSWGVLALYRGAGDPPFDRSEVAQLATVLECVAEAIAGCLFGRPAGGDARPVIASPADPAVLIIDAANRVSHQTPAARAAIADLGGWDHGSLPANMLSVIAATRTSGVPTQSRVQTPAGTWLNLRAAPLTGPADGPDVVVTVDVASRAALSRLALAAHGLTAREEEVAVLVLQGADTRAIAGSLHLSPFTVQDHLKKIFEKVGVSSRRDLIARLAVD